MNQRESTIRAALIVLVILFQTSAAADVRTFRWQGVERLYRLHNAEVGAETAAPLVVYLHGYRKRAEAIEGRNTLDRISWSRLEATATSEGFVVASPAAHWGKWNLLDGLRNTTLGDGTRLDDVGFVFALIDALVADGIADPARIYLTGISDGAIMSYRLLCTPESPFIAAVALIGTMTEIHRDACLDARPTPIMVIAGTLDRTLPYDGRIFRTGRQLSVPETMEYWRRLHGCTGQKSEALDDVDTEDGSQVRLVHWTGCATEGAVKLLRIEGGGHRVPRLAPTAGNAGERKDGRNYDIDGAEEAWRFVSSFTRQKH